MGAGKPTKAEAGRLGGLKNGRKRARRLSPARRKAIATKAAEARWGPDYKPKRKRRRMILVPLTERRTWFPTSIGFDPEKVDVRVEGVAVHGAGWCLISARPGDRREALSLRACVETIDATSFVDALIARSIPACVELIDATACPVDDAVARSLPA